MKCILVSPEGVAAKKYNEMKNNEVSCISKIIFFDSLIFSCSPSRLTILKTLQNAVYLTMCLEPPAKNGTSIPLDWTFQMFAGG